MISNLSKQFRSRGLQSVLIVIAVALGSAVVTAVAAFLELGNASSRNFAESVEGRKITITARANDHSAFYQDGVSIPVVKIGAVNAERVVFSVEDIDKARAFAPLVEYAYVEVAEFMAPASVDMAFVDAWGITPDYLIANNIQVSAGSSFIQDDFEKQKRVALVSPRLVKAMKDNMGRPIQGNGLGETLETYEIVGILEETDDPYAPNMLIPFPENPFNSIESLTFLVKDAANLEEARAQLETYGRSVWGERVTVRSRSSSSYDVQARAAGFIVAILASVGLVVAGLNIMNLMTARVLEQSKNIGILRSVGASRASIRNRYLLDALTLGLLGGALGIGFGYLLILIFNRYIQTASSDVAESLQIHLSLQAPLIGVAMACVLSLLFAWYPALVASRTNIINALKEQ